jgi:AraC-like DNA-binding protein
MAQQTFCAAAAIAGPHLRKNCPQLLLEKRVVEADKMHASGNSDFAAMLDRQAPGNAHYSLGDASEPIVVANRHAPAHEFINPGTPHLCVMVVPHYRLTQALFDLGTGLRDHFCPEPQPVHVLPPDSAYRWTVNGSSMTVMLALPMAEVRSVLAELEYPDPMNALWSVMDRGFVEPMAYEIVLRLWALAKANKRCPALLLQSHMTCLLHALVVRGNTQPRRVSQTAGLNSAQLSSVIEMLEARMEEDLTLEELAAACGMTRFHFSRLFRQSTGYAPYRYLVIRRIEKARGLLLATDEAVSQIGVAVGFVDPGHFSRTFTRHVGVSPQRFRASAR